MKLFRISFILFISFITSPASNAQKTQWGDLLINLPVGWSSNMKNGNMVYSNYNLVGNEPFSITLFKPESFTGKPDSLFYAAWKKYLSPVLGTTEVPRPKRLITEGELPVFFANKEVADKSSPAYYVLGIYVLDGTYQTFLIQTTLAKIYREVQAEWQERLTGVIQLSPPKKK